MLGFFKSKNDKNGFKNQRSSSETKETKRNTLKKVKSEDGATCKKDNPEKTKEERTPRFSFKRTKANDRKRRISLLGETSASTKRQESADNSSEDLISNDLTSDEESRNSSLSSLSVDKSEDSLKTKEKTCDQEPESSVKVYKTASLPTQWNYVEKRKTELDNSNSKSPLVQNSNSFIEKRYGTLPQYPSSEKEKVNLANNYCAKVCLPSFQKRYDKSAVSSNEVDPTSKQSIIPDETYSIRSTPSSSTSSLSSISGRPISPSGRKTPPGPKMGTGICLSPSPTYSRKHFRSNIKTNPSIPVRKICSSSTPNNSTIIYHSPQSGLPPITIPKRHSDENKYKVSDNLKFNASKGAVVVSESSDSNCDSQDDLQTPPLSPVSSPARARHSASSMHSLESIPEAEIDVGDQSKDQHGRLPNLPKRQPYIRMINNEGHTTNGNTEDSSLISAYKYYSPPRVKEKFQTIGISNNFANSPSLDRTEISLKLKNLNALENKIPFKETSGLPKSGTKDQKINNDQSQEFETLVSARVVLPISDNARMPKSDCNLQQIVVSPTKPNVSATNIQERSHQDGTTNSSLMNGEETASLASLPSDPPQEVTHGFFSIPIRSPKEEAPNSFVNSELNLRDRSSERSRPSRRDLCGAAKRTQPTPKQNLLHESKVSNVSPHNDRKLNDESKLSVVTKEPFRETSSLPDPPKSPANRDPSSVSDYGESSSLSKEIPKTGANRDVKAPEEIYPSATWKIKSPFSYRLREDEAITVPIRPKRTRSLSRDKRRSLPGKIEGDASQSDQRNLAEDPKSSEVPNSSGNLKSSEEPKSSGVGHKVGSADAAVQTDAEDSHPKSDEHKSEVASLEKKYQEQVDQLTLKLAEKQQESSSLKEELEEIQKSQEEDNSEERLQELQTKVEELKRKVVEKDTALEGIRLGFQQAKNESENSKSKIRSLEDELNSSKQGYLSSEEQMKTKFTARIGELEAKVKTLEEKLEKSESTCRNLQQSLDEIEEEREEELKIVQDALDEAAQEREDLIATFKKELENANNMNSAREQQMLEDFEWKLSEMEKDNKKRQDEKERQAENTLTRPKRHTEDEEVKQKTEKLRNEINAEWEDKLRSECSRLKRELDELHAEEKHLAVESIKVQKEQEMFTAKTSLERRIEELNKSISTLNDKLSEKDAYYQSELESVRMNSDRDIWSLRMKLQRLDDSSQEKIQQMEDNHREEMERLKTDYQDRIQNLESRIAACDEQMGVDVIGQLNKEHREQMEHLEEQHRLSLERFREESESEKFQEVEEARVILTKHHEDIENGLRDQLSEALSTCSKLREEMESIKAALSNKEDEIRSLEEDVDSLKSSHCDSSATPQELPVGASCTSSGISSSQYSLASSNGSRLSQDRISLSELSGVASESQDETQKNANGSLLGKVFGGGWFSGPKSKDGVRRGSTPSSKRNSST